jgi:predicted acyltransferase
MAGLATQTQAAEQKRAEGSREVKKERLPALDVFRGFTLLGMVFVNSIPGKNYPGLGHVAWNGWGFADLIFPFFVFIVGVAIPYSFSARMARGEAGAKLFWQILRRCVLLFVVGVLLNAYPQFDIEHARIMNVLQRIAICYFVVSVVYIYVRPRAQTVVLLSGAILVAYFILLRFVPVPGYGAGVLEPVGNWANYIDRLVMSGHMRYPLWEHKTLLGCVPALVTMWMGLLAGLYLRTAMPVYEKLTHLFLCGGLAMIAGAIWSQWFPINQGLWTSSLVLFMGGLAVMGLAASYYAVDVRKSTWWTPPFLVFGTNSLMVWILSVMGEKTLHALHTTAPDGSTVTWWDAGNNALIHILGAWTGPLVFGGLCVLLWLCVLCVLYRRRIFIRF